MASKTIAEDGYEWIQRAGQLWGDYQTSASYIGMKPDSFAVYRYKHNLRTIKHGRKSMVRKSDLDRATGAQQQLGDQR